ncbi:MAG: hypothetical protein HON47_01490 [Candidatus Diapherotrites archaeon]|uniref:Response regulator n=1 Tax=Candidatus Iainarchaeum sp. TaxID=3101447 RepID=A0A8T5GE34_9ARCH|nr:hypothetical protein [Candidatus Diapherotrites archaeon]
MIEDEPDKFSPPVKKICKALGYEFTLVENVADARKVVAKKKFNMVVSDLSLRSGEGPLRFLSEYEIKERAHVVLFSLRSLGSKRMFGFHYVPKINPVELLDILMKLKDHPHIAVNEKKRVHGDRRKIKHVAVGAKEKQKIDRVYDRLAQTNPAELKNFLMGRKKATKREMIRRLEKSQTKGHNPRPWPGSALAAMDRKEEKALDILKKKVNGRNGKRK